MLDRIDTNKINIADVLAEESDFCGDSDKLGLPRQQRHSQKSSQKSKKRKVVVDSDPGAEMPESSDEDDQNATTIYKAPAKRPAKKGKKVSKARK